MIDENTYKQVMIAKLSGLVEMKNDKEIWWKDEDLFEYNGFMTIELLDNEKLILRTFYENGKVWTEEPYKNGKTNGKLTRYCNDGSIECEAYYKNDRLIWMK